MGILFDRESHPVRGAWIEIADGRLQTRTYEKSHPVRGAWIEIIMANNLLICPAGRIP